MSDIDTIRAFIVQSAKIGNEASATCLVLKKDGELCRTTLTAEDWSRPATKWELEEAIKAHYQTEHPDRSVTIDWVTALSSLRKCSGVH